jgi:hypothetical protein
VDKKMSILKGSVTLLINYPQLKNVGKYWRRERQGENIP